MQSSIYLLPLWAQILLAFVPATGTAFAAMGLWLNVKQSRRTNAQNRAAVVTRCLERFTDDADIQLIFYKIEYSEFKYNQDLHNSTEEKQLDKLLTNFSTVALGWQSGLLKDEDLLPLQYLVRRVFRNPDVKEYLNFVERWTSTARLGMHPYLALAKMAHMLEAASEN